MKTNMKCKLYKFLFRVLPIPAWQAFLMEKHLCVCPHCREETAAEDQIKALPVSPGEAKTLPDLWPYVHRHIEEPPRKAKPGIAFFPGWQWKTAAVGLLLLLAVVFSPFYLEKKQSPTPGIDGGTPDKVVVKSVKIGSEAAKFYFFESKDPDKLIVWAQRK